MKARSSGTDAVTAALEVGRQGLEVLVGDWVRWTIEKDSRPPGLARNRSSWSCRVGCDEKLLTFSTGGTFSNQDILLLERVEEMVDLLLRLTAPTEPEGLTPGP